MQAEHSDTIFEWDLLVKEKELLLLVAFKNFNVGMLSDIYK